MRRLIAVTVLSAMLVAAGAASPAFACGCGAVVGPPDSKTTASNERAILYWEAGLEVMELTFDVRSDSLTAGVVVPTPTPATISVADPRTFDLIENTIAPTERIETDWWGLDYILPKPKPAEVTVLDRVRMDGMEATTLAASDSAGLTAWLATNGFDLSEKMLKSFDVYIQLGWSFTAVRLTDTSAVNGHIDPLRLSFGTPRLVYPMRLASEQSKPQHVRLYVFDGQRSELVKASNPTRSLDGTVTVAWAGTVADTRLTALGAYLTVFDVDYAIPKDEATSDIGAVASLTGRDVHPEVVRYRMVTLLGAPVGTLIVLWALVGLALVLGHVVGRRRAR